MNGGELETYRIDWEAARVGKIEGFNKRRASFKGRLEAMKADVEAARKLGSCTPAEADQAQIDIREGQRSMDEEMQYEYEELLVIYAAELQWYKVMIKGWKDCRTAGKCEDGFDYA